MLRFGNITEVNPETGFARVTFLDDGIVSDWLQVLVRAAIVDKDSFTFDVNEQVACLMDENSEEGVILGALFNEKTKPPEGGGAGIFRMVFGDESILEYNRNTHKLKADIKGDIDIFSTGTVNVEAVTASVAAESVQVDATAVTVEADTVEVMAVSVSVDADEVEVVAPIINIEGVINVVGSLTVSGAVAAASISAPVISGPGVTMSGGNMAASGEVSGATVKAGTVDLGTHVHAGVTPGGGSTSPPTP